MKRILLDTNVLLDALLNRDPFSSDALQLFSLVESGKVVGVISVCSITTVYYFGRRAFSEEESRRDLEDLSRHFVIQSADAALILRAVIRGGRDFEDDTIVESALASGCEAIITRNVRDFRTSPVPAVTPREWLAGYNEKTA